MTKKTRANAVVSDKEEDDDDDVEMVSAEEDNLPEMTTKPNSSKSTKSAKVRDPSIQIIDDSDDNKKTTTKKDKKKEQQPPAKKAKKLAVDDEDDVIVLDGNGDEEEESEGEEEEYAIERILKHKTADDGTTMYLIRWEGYEEADDTWEPESNCNAPELVAQYWKGMPTARQPRKKEKVQKKLETVKSPQKKQNSNSPAKGNNTSENEEAEEVANALHGDGEDSVVTPSKKREYEEMDQEALREKELANSIALLAKWRKKESWEESLNQVETVVRDDDEVLRAQLSFKNGDVFWVDKDIAYSKCPQAMLKFYEAHLRFRMTNDSNA